MTYGDPAPDEEKKEPIIKAPKITIGAGAPEVEAAAIGDVFISSDGTARIKTGTTSSAVISSSPGLPTPIAWTPSPPSTTSGGMVFPPAKKPKPSKTLETPTKTPRKLLVAFLNDDDEVEWCAKVHPGTLNIDYNPASIAPEMSLSFYLIEVD